MYIYIKYIILFINTFFLDNILKTSLFFFFFVVFFLHTVKNGLQNIAMKTVNKFNISPFCFACLPLRVSMDLGNHGQWRKYSTFPKAPAFAGASPSHCFSVISRTLVWGGGCLTPLQRKQSEYSTAPVDEAKKIFRLKRINFFFFFIKA